MKVHFRVKVDLYEDAKTRTELACGCIPFARRDGHNFPADICAMVEGVFHDQGLPAAIEKAHQWLQTTNAQVELQEAGSIMQEKLHAAADKIGVGLVTLTGRPLHAEVYTIFVTGAGGCPYNYSAKPKVWVGKGYVQHVIGVVLHEMLHMQTHQYFEKDMMTYCDEFSFWHVKEALTTLLNEVFRPDFMGSLDWGYPDDGALRKRIQHLYIQGENFESICMRMAKHAASLIH